MGARLGCCCRTGLFSSPRCKIEKMRSNGRAPEQLREISLETRVNKHAEGSCLAKFGDTHILCTASIDDRVPGWLRDAGHGWVTAEYGMLPRSTGARMTREAALGKQGGRTLEIQRLIGRSLRAVMDLYKLGEIQVRVDCDVLQADGGTRTASVTGAYVALYDACRNIQELGLIKELPFNGMVAAVSCGLYQGETILDLDYEEDSNAQADTNFVLTDLGQIVEIQATAEDNPFSEEELSAMMSLARKGIGLLITHQKKALDIG